MTEITVEIRSCNADGAFISGRANKKLPTLKGRRVVSIADISEAMLATADLALKSHAKARRDQKKLHGADV